MRQPNPSMAPSPRASEDSPAPAATETVTRPEPGLARGKWEAPASFFWVMLTVIAVGAAVYLFSRLGILRIGRNNENKKKEKNGIPASSGRHP